MPASLETGAESKTPRRPRHCSFSPAVQPRGYALGYIKLTIDQRANLASNHRPPRPISPYYATHHAGLRLASMGRANIHSAKRSTGAKAAGAGYWAPTTNSA